MVAEFESNRFISLEDLDRDTNTKPVFYKRSSYIPNHAVGSIKEDKKEK